MGSVQKADIVHVADGKASNGRLAVAVGGPVASLHSLQLLSWILPIFKSSVEAKSPARCSFESDREGGNQGPLSAPKRAQAAMSPRHPIPPASIFLSLGCL